MIADYQTNTVYLADAFGRDSPIEFRKFRKFLENHGITVKILSRTNDIYCRDYMPVQVDKNTFLQFVFRPDKYYKRSEIEFISNPVLVHIANKFQNIRYSNIILDGGNVVKGKDKVIITDKVFEDNYEQFNGNKEEITEQLKKELRCEVIVIPCHPGDKTGHADGLIKFIDENTVFINDPIEEHKKWLNEFMPILRKNDLTAIPLPCFMKSNQKSADGLYINYLHVGKLVVVPKFGPGYADKDALEKIQDKMDKTNTVVSYPANKIAKYGGLLNCVTWSIFSSPE